MNEVANLLARPVYGFAQVDHVLGLTGGTARRWIDGYERTGRRYQPVVRLESTGDEVVTWGEFVEARLLAEYRSSGVTMARMRPVVEKLREHLQTPFPLASSRSWLESDGRELIWRVQQEVGLPGPLALVVRTQQLGFVWSTEAGDFAASADWSDDRDQKVLRRLRPAADLDEVWIDPLRSFGEPTVRGVRTEIIAELVRAGEKIDAIAETYELPRSAVDSAVRYELLRARAS